MRAVRHSRVADALIAHEHRTAAGLFALLVLVYLWPALIGGGVLSPTLGMYLNPPWIGLAPADIFHHFNGGLEDVPLGYYPWDVLARQLIHAGTFPAWNPHALGGTPLFANSQVAWLSPFSLPLWILPLHDGLGVAAALKLWMAGFGAYLLVRELKLGFWPGMLAGVSFALCAFNISWLSHGVQVSVAVLLPWTIWLVERIVRQGRPAAGLALAGIVAFVLTGGHPGTQLHVLAAAVLYALARGAASADVARRERIRRLGLVGAALALGALLTAVVLLPAQQAAVGTAGALARRHGSVEFLGSHMSFGMLRTALFPDWWGRISDGVVSGPADNNERTFYAGSAALVLAVLGLLAGGGWRRKGPFVLLGALGAGIALRAPGLFPLVTHLPLFNSVQNQRILLWFVFAVAVLAAFGLEAVLDAPRERRVWGVLAGAALAALVGAASIDLHGETAGQVARYLVHRSGAITESALALASVVWWLVFVGALAAVLLLARVRPGPRWRTGALVALVAALDMLHFAHGYQPVVPASEAVPPRTPAIAYLQRHLAEGRYVGVAGALPTDFSTVYGLRGVGGYDAPQPSLRFFHLWQTMNPDQSLAGAYTVPAVTPESLRVTGLLGARYVVTARGAQVGSAGLSPAYRGRDATIYVNPLALPRALVVPHAVLAADEEAELSAVVREGFDPRQDAVVPRDEGGGTPIAASGGGGGGTARVVAERNARVALRATLSRPGVVVLDDAWAPGWSVRVDGRPARALRTDVVLRGVAVGAGTHAIVWSYRVPGLRLGAALSGLGLLLALGWGGWLVVRARRRAP